MKHKDLTKLLVDAQITSDMSAMTATTDGSVPTVIKRLIGQRGDQWEITAITPGTQRRYVPASPLTTDRLYRWSADRLFGKQVTPPAAEVVEEGYYVRVMGNAVVAESWLRDRGWHSAYAGHPTRFGSALSARARCALCIEGITTSATSVST
jgi:hypothetical protein